MQEQMLIRTDPLKWNWWFKLLMLLQVSFLRFLGPFSQGAIVSLPVQFGTPRASTDKMCTQEPSLRAIGKGHARHRHRSLLPNHHLHRCRRNGAVDLFAFCESIRSSSGLYVQQHYRHRCWSRPCFFQIMRFVARGQNLRRRWPLRRYGDWRFGGCGYVFHA